MSISEIILLFVKNTQILQFASLIRHSPHYYAQYQVGWFVAAQIPIVQLAHVYEIHNLPMDDTL